MTWTVRCSRVKRAVRVMSLKGFPVEGPERETSKKPHCSMVEDGARAAAEAIRAGSKPAARVAAPSLMRSLRCMGVVRPCCCRDQLLMEVACCDGLERVRSINAILDVSIQFENYCI